jgi:hypothetical protein
MSAPDEVVFLFDCDNTLLDNDRVQEDLRAHLAGEFGPENRDRYWKIFETLRAELGYADYLGALQRYRLGDLRDTRLLLMSSFLVDYPFASRLYPGALDAIRRLRAEGLTVILSDGDVVFQPRKIERSGLSAAIEGRVLIYIHKEEMLDAVAERADRRALRLEPQRRQRRGRSDVPVHDRRLGRSHPHGSILPLCDADADRNEGSLRRRFRVRHRP